MSRYFKYKTLADLDRDARDKGLDIRLTDDMAPLLEPFHWGGRAVGNRMAVQPMEGCDGTLDGAPDELTFRRYERFGAGGAKLIWGEAAAVVPEGRANTRQLLVNDVNLPGLARMVDLARSAHKSAWGDDGDLVIGLQLTHSGRYSVPRPIIAQHDPLLDHRTILNRATGEVVGPDTPLISDDELDRLQDSYVAAAKLAQKAGYDFVDIKQCHKYLLNELLASRTRPGKYGGSFENRTRFILTLIDRLKAEVPGLLLATRMNVYDGLPYRKGGEDVESIGLPADYQAPVTSCWGTNPDNPVELDLTEPIALIAALRDRGIQLINVTMGNPYANPHFLRPFEYAPVDAYQTPEHPLIGVDRHFRAASTIQQTFPDVFVLGSGYSWLQAFTFHAGAANIRDGRVSLVGIGRNALSHPDFGGYVMQGKPLDPKRLCRTFSECTALMRAKHNALGQFATGCPPFDKAVYGPIFDEAETTKPK